MIGKYIGNYEIDEIVDKGGMSIVYLGVHKDLKRRVAIKMLNPVLHKNPQYARRFLNEAVLLSHLNHPNIIALYDYEHNSNGTFLITEYIEGQTLDQYIDLTSGPMPETKALKLIEQILSAIAHMHSKNMIHRDIKPSNIMITNDYTVKIIDLGIAKQLQKDKNVITEGGSKLGTTMFMSPQQVRGKVLDRRTDIYSIGASLFYMLTGQYPYEKTLSEYEIYNRIVNDPFPDPHDVYKGVSEKMRNIVEKATQKQPLKRYQSCNEFANALRNTPPAGKRKEPSNISLQTKIIEAAGDIRLGKKNTSSKKRGNSGLLVSLLIFVFILTMGIYFLTRKDIRHVLGNEIYLLESDSAGAKKIEQLHYGETVRIISRTTNAQKEIWYKVAGLRNTIGYVNAKDIEVKHVYKQINSIFGNTAPGLLIPTEYKQALRRYYIDNQLFEQEKKHWKLFAEKLPYYTLNKIAFGYFDDDDQQDFACIIQNKDNQQCKFIIFFHTGSNISVDMNEDIKIKTIRKGKAGGKWFLGKNIPRLGKNGKSYKVKKYEYLKNDGILLFKPKSNENIVYFYKPEEKMIKFFSQQK